MIMTANIDPFGHEIRRHSPAAKVIFLEDYVQLGPVKPLTGEVDLDRLDRMIDAVMLYREPL